MCKLSYEIPNDSTNTIAIVSPISRHHPNNMCVRWRPEFKDRTKSNANGWQCECYCVLLLQYFSLGIWPCTRLGLSLESDERSQKKVVNRRRPQTEVGRVRVSPRYNVHDFGIIEEEPRW